MSKSPNRADGTKTGAELQCIESAYIAMLRLPHGVVRFNNQALLCMLRDLICEVSGRDAESVQNYYEGCAATNPEGMKK